MASAVQSSTGDSLGRFIQFCPRDTRTLMEVLRRLAPDNVLDLERRANKLRWSLAHGWKLRHWYEVWFLSELTPEERRVTDEKFLPILESCWPERPIEPTPEEEPRSQRPCILGRLCLNLSNKGPAYARIRSRYCSEACRGRAEFYRQHPEVCPAARMVG